MEICRSDRPRAPVEVLAHPPLPGGHGEHAGQYNGGWNGGAFEVGHFVAAFRETLGGDVVPGEPADPATDEIDQRDPVPSPA